MSVVIRMPNGDDLRLESPKEPPGPGLAELIRTVEEGVDKSTVDRLTEKLGIPKVGTLALLEIDPSTYTRRRNRLNRHESERVLRLLRLADEGIIAFKGDNEAFRRWFAHPNILLGNLTPLHACRFDFGIGEVEKLLGRIQTGDFIA